MVKPFIDHGLAFLLDFDGRIHHLEHGYWIKFEIKKVVTGKERPHGLSYSFTLHGPDGTRLIGFDNAHGVPSKGSRFNPPPETHDHWHRTEEDPGRPYRYKDSATLVDDFFAEVERVMSERGLGTTVVRTKARDEDDEV
jgi:hypothetical protein